MAAARSVWVVVIQPAMIAGVTAGVEALVSYRVILASQAIRVTRGAISCFGARVSAACALTIASIAVGYRQR